MNNYEEKQQAKKERYEELAEKNSQKSDQLWEEGSSALKAIPFGQPILIGHHSEKGHRSYLAKNRAKMDRAIETSKKADYYAQKAENVGSGGISSDDPEAIEKLKIKLAQLEDKQTDMKEQNAEARALKLDKPFAGFQLTNNNANIRTVKLRIKRLENKDNMEEKKDVIGDGYIIKEDKEDNRIRFIFEGKPSDEIRKVLKSNGFRWSPYNTAWQRMLNGNGRYATKRVINSLR